MQRYSRVKTHRDSVDASEISNGEFTLGRTQPLRIGPLHNDPAVVNDAELEMVLRKLMPTFRIEGLRPNIVEHALRLWQLDSQFDDPKALSGGQMLSFLIDHRELAKAWGDDVEPLLSNHPFGVEVRWGREGRTTSIHRDHCLACMAEAGVSLNIARPSEQYPGRSIRHILAEALYDFSPDEREIEWSTVAFAYWLPPISKWTNGEGRSISFDMLAQRLMRGSLQYGGCFGTHRLHALAVLWRINEEDQILSPIVRDSVYAHLRNVCQLLTLSQRRNGFWDAGWWTGQSPPVGMQTHSTYDDLIVTGHHLEWLALMPNDLQLPHFELRQAARAVIDATLESSEADIKKYFTCYSHIGGALSLWRGNHAADFLKSQRRRVREPVEHER